MAQKLLGIQEIRRFLPANERPICFFGPGGYSLFGLEGQVGNLHFIVRHDCFEDNAPGVFIPTECWGGVAMSIIANNNNLLRHPEVAEYVQALGPNPGALFLMFDAETEALCERLGLEILFPSAALRNRLDDKVETVRIGNRAGVPSVPNFLGAVASYEDLLTTADRHQLGTDLVVQTPYGDSGYTTFFVANAADWERAANQIRTERAVKVMKRINCGSLTQEACLTRWGTLVAPLQRELIGLPELTSDRGGWCGNQLADGTVSATLERRAHSYTLKLAEQLQQLGYRGHFNVDYLVDLETDDLYLGELNPRISGATPLSSLSSVVSKQLPLVLAHLLEYSDVNLDPDAFMAAYDPMALNMPWSSLIIKYQGSANVRVSAAPEGGIWKRDARGGISYDRRTSHSLALTGEDEAFVQRVARPGFQLVHGHDLARVIVRDRVLTPENRLNEQARGLVQSITDLFALQEEFLSEESSLNDSILQETGWR